MIRRATVHDLAAFALHEQDAEQAGQFSEWGGITHQDLARQLEDTRMELWAVEDAAGTPRGYIRMEFGGLVQWPRTSTGDRPVAPTRPALLWRYALGVITRARTHVDPSLAAGAWARLYLRSCREIALTHAGEVLEGSVVAAGTLDRLWRRYVADWRTLREAPRTGGGTVRTAWYQGPAEEFARRLAAI